MTSPSQADFFLHSWDNHHEKKSSWNLGFNVAYYSTSTNFDPTGVLNSYSTLRNYTRIQTDLNLSYGISDQLTAFGRTSWAYINQNSDLRPGTAFGFADQTVGLNFRIFHSKSPTDPPRFVPFALDLQVQMDFPAYATVNSEANLTPYLGDGTTDVTGGFLATVPIHRGKMETFSLVAGGGYTYRTLGFSSAIPWSAVLRYDPSFNEGFFANLGGMGIMSLNTDPSGVLTSVPRSSAGAGGSFYIGAVDPSLVQIRGQGGYKLTHRTEFSLSVMQTVWGQSAPNGISIFLCFQTRFGSVYREHNPLLMSPNSYGHSNSGFLNYSLESKVLKSNDRLNLVKIDKGSQDGVETGQVFDIFAVKKDGLGGEAVARGRVSNVKLNEAAIEITEFFKEIWIDEGFSAKRLIQ
jgi:hypothetical protein